MSHLTLVRHGQATFPYEAEDHLTGIGRAQARSLGSFWAERSVRFDQVYTGPGGRHRETASLAGEVLRRQGLPWPEAIVLKSLDEYQAGAILNVGLARLRKIDARVEELWQSSESAVDPLEKDRAWNRMFEIALRLWAREKVELEGVEPWTDFRSRVRGGLAEIVAGGGRGRNVAAFTSGGTIGVMTGHALEASTRSTLNLAWMVRNASISEFLFTENRFTLSTFNAFSHLQGPSELTYR